MGNCLRNKLREEKPPVDHSLCFSLVIFFMIVSLIIIVVFVRLFLWAMED